MDPHRDLVQQCLALTQRDRFEEAVQLAESFVQQDQDDGHLWQLLGLLRHRARDMEGAREALETSSMLVPLEPAARCALADCYARTGYRELAVDIYNDLAADMMCPLELLGAVASGLGSLGQNEYALEVCRTLVRREPNSPEGHFGIAFYLRRMGASIAVALPAASKAQELAPHVPLYTVALASMFSHLGRNDEARELLRDLDPKSVTCRCCLQRMSAILHRGGEAGGEPQGLHDSRPQNQESRGTDHAL
ncbi:tetratricopeptide repeat protein [Singulisphaera sp. PoT]|uniref:tetratricopeptide repeat protein n=1 Tax=Singulisphaera sp. PoT TaxID=3411797 RepID=UPI003BF4B944